MKCKRSCSTKTTLKSMFTEIEIPDKEFDDMKEGEQRLYIDKYNSKMILEIYRGRKNILYITGYVSFVEG